MTRRCGHDREEHKALYPNQCKMCECQDFDDTCPVHLTPLPCHFVCLAHMEHEPCQTCAAYIAAGL